ncbi:MAG: hypothetical protein AAF658_14635, partial [Myxococcota bacterium]
MSARVVAFVESAVTFAPNLPGAKNATISIGFAATTPLRVGDVVQLALHPRSPGSFGGDCGPCPLNGSSASNFEVQAWSSEPKGILRANLTVINASIDAHARVDLTIAEPTLTLPQTAIFATNDATTTKRLADEGASTNSSFVGADLALLQSLDGVLGAPVSVDVLQPLGLSSATIAIEGEVVAASSGTATATGARAARRAALRIAFVLAKPWTLGTPQNRTTIRKHRLSEAKEVVWVYRGGLEVYGEVAFEMPGFYDPRERADPLISGSVSDEDLSVGGRDARYFVARWETFGVTGAIATEAGVLAEASRLSPHDNNETWNLLNGSLRLYAVAPLAPRPQGYEVTIDTLVAPVHGVSSGSHRQAFTVSVLDADGSSTLVAPTPLSDGGPRLNALRGVSLALDPPDRAGERVALNFSFSLRTALAPGDTLALSLPGITACAKARVGVVDSFPSDITVAIAALDTSVGGTGGIRLELRTSSASTSIGHIALPLEAGLSVSESGVDPSAVTVEILPDAVSSAPLAPTPIAGDDAPLDLDTSPSGPFRGVGAFIEAR